MGVLVMFSTVVYYLGIILAEIMYQKANGEPLPVETLIMGSTMVILMELNEIGQKLKEVAG